MLEVIIILGKGIKAGGSLPTLVQHELQYVASLCYTQTIKAIICSGDYWGLQDKPGTQSEAELMAAAIRSLLPPEVMIIPENRSKDTIGSLLYCKEILDQLGYRRVLIMSSADHLPRIQYIAEQVFGQEYELDYHGHQHTYSWRQYLHTLRYERLAHWYARWFFYRLAHHSLEQWQQYHFMYHPNLALTLAKFLIRSRPIHR